jgi:hypothetical protein
VDYAGRHGVLHVLLEDATLLSFLSSSPLV